MLRPLKKGGSITTVKGGRHKARSRMRHRWESKRIIEEVGCT
jgi:hypothetical protein